VVSKSEQTPQVVSVTRIPAGSPEYIKSVNNSVCTLQVRIDNIGPLEVLTGANFAATSGIMGVEKVAGSSNL
jgi:hypothetical protein